MAKKGPTPAPGPDLRSQAARICLIGAVALPDAAAFILPGGASGNEEMGKNMEPKPHTPPPAGWWHELNCRDAGAARAFYGRMMGWTFEDIALPEGKTYCIARRGEAPVCGIFEMDPALHDEVPDHWMTYLATADIDMTLRGALRAGGEVVRAPAPVPGVGRLALMADAGGALIGLMEPHPTHPLRRAEARERLRQVAALMEEAEGA